MSVPVAVTGFELLLLKFLLGGAAGAAAGVAIKLTWDQVNTWVMRHRVPSGLTELVQTHLSDGNYRVVANVFGAGGTPVASTSWTAKTLDPVLAERFQGRSRVVIGESS